MVSKINKVTYLVVLVHGREAESRKRKKVGEKKKKEKKKGVTIYNLGESNDLCEYTVHYTLIKTDRAYDVATNYYKTK